MTLSTTCTVVCCDTKRQHEILIYDIQVPADVMEAGAFGSTIFGHTVQEFFQDAISSIREDELNEVVTSDEIEVFFAFKGNLIPQFDWRT